PWGGAVTAIGRAKNTLVAATDGEGIFRSDDGGLSWNWSSNDYFQEHIDRFIAHGSTVIGLNSAAYRSSDAGITWQSMNSQGFSRSMAFVGETLISITPSGDVYASGDLGDQWKLRSQLGAFPIINTIAVRGDTVLAGARNGLYRSIDGGYTWNGLRVDTNENSVHTICITGNSILVSAGNQKSDQADHCYRSTDGGDSWNKVLNGLPVGHVRSMIASNGMIYLAGGVSGTLFRSADDGITWSPVAGSGADDINVLAAIGDTLVAGCGAASHLGILRSTDRGTTGMRTTTGLSAVGIWRLLRSGNTMLAAPYHHGLYRTTDNGGSWNLQDIGSPGFYINAMAVQGDYLLAGLAETDSNHGEIYRSSDAGITWSQVLADTGGVVEFAAEGTSAIALMGNSFGTVGLRRSTDFGATWDVISGPETSPSTPVTHILSHQAGLFAFTNGAVFRSYDHGNMWDSVSSLADYNLDIGSVFSSGTVIFATRSGVSEEPVIGYAMLYRSTDNGVRWSPSYISGEVTAMAASGTEIYAATMERIYMSTSNGKHWQYISDYPYENLVPSLAVAGPTLFIGTMLNGVFSISPFTTSVQRDAPESNDVIMVPDITSGNAEVRYVLTKRRNVAIDIFDGLGERVEGMAGRDMDAGSHSLAIDASSWPAGIYFCRVTIDGERTVRRLIVTR
ncbi:MAG: hypothetical protein ABIR47_18195, partial [Candidatus Kapaibacterium sp.]